MDSRLPRPHALVSRSLIAALVFGAAVVPGWLLAEFAERLTGWALLGLLTSSAWSAAAVAVLAPRVSYRRIDAVLGAVPLFGWYLICVLAWRVAFLPYRDWEPRPDEQRRARWLTAEEHLGIWRMDPVRPPTADRVPAAPGRRTGDRHRAVRPEAVRRDTRAVR